MGRKPGRVLDLSRRRECRRGQRPKRVARKVWGSWRQGSVGDAAMRSRFRKDRAREVAARQAMEGETSNGSTSNIQRRGEKRLTAADYFAQLLERGPLRFFIVVITPQHRSISGWSISPRERPVSSRASAIRALWGPLTSHLTGRRSCSTAHGRTRTSS